MKMSAKVTASYGMTVSELKAVLDNVPDTATVSVRTHQGDRYQLDWHTIEFSWDA